MQRRELLWLLAVLCVCAVGAFVFRREPAPPSPRSTPLSLDYRALSVGRVQPGMSWSQVQAAAGSPTKAVGAARNVEDIYEDPASRAGRGGGPELQSVNTCLFPLLEVVFGVAEKGENVEWVRGDTLEHKGQVLLKADSSPEEWRAALGSPTSKTASGIRVDTWVIGPWSLSLAKDPDGRAPIERAIGLSRPPLFPPH